MRARVFLGLFLVASAARADEPGPDEVVVRGSEAGGFVSRARIEDEPREVTDAASLVEPLPGVHVRRLGAEDSFATLSVRGTSSTEVAIFLAGVPLTGGADPTLDLATLPLWPGAEARVYRSFAPAALGRGSLGGTLVLDPPSPRARLGDGGDRASTDVWGAIGSFGARRLRIGDIRSLSPEPDAVRVATGVSASRSDDDFTYLDPLASEARHADVFATRVNSGHADANGLASIAIPLSPREGGGALTLTSLAQARRQELPGTIDAPTPFQRLDASRLLEALELTVPGGGGAFGVRGWGRRETLSLRDAPGATPVVFGPTRTEDVIVAAGGSFGWKGRPTTATSVELRVDGSGERFAPGTWVGATQPPSATRTSGGMGLDAQARVAPSLPLTLAASARGDLWSDASDAASTRLDARPTGNVGAELDLDAVKLATHGGVLARPASFVERFGDRGTFLGEPTLRPEAAATVDAGVRTATRHGPLRLETELSTFATWADDLIVFVFVGASGRSKATNIGRARLLGLEGSVHASAWGGALRVSYTGLATANESECRFTQASACARPPLPGRPEHDLVADLSWALGPARVRYGIDLVAGARADVDGAIVVPDRVLHSAGVRVAVPGIAGLTLALDVRNLFDLRAVDYAAPAGQTGLGPTRAPIGDVFQFPLPGRSFLFSARYAVSSP